MCRLRSKWMVGVMMALGISALGCASLGSAHHYEPADREGNQCRNECYAAPDLNDQEECMRACYNYNGGTFQPSAGCFMTAPDAVSKEPPQGARSEVWQTPANLVPASHSTP